MVARGRGGQKTDDEVIQERSWLGSRKAESEWWFSGAVRAHDSSIRYHPLGCLFFMRARRCRIIRQFNRRTRLLRRSHPICKAVATVTLFHD